MNEIEVKPYRLYALLAIRENVEFVVDEPFVRVSGEYILVYTDGEQPPYSIEIDEDIIRKLTAADMNWPWDCMVAVTMQNLKTEEAQQMQKLSETMVALEQALAAERASVKGDNR